MRKLTLAMVHVLPRSRGSGARRGPDASGLAAERGLVKGEIGYARVASGNASWSLADNSALRVRTSFIEGPDPPTQSRRSASSPVPRVRTRVNGKVKYRMTGEINANDSIAVMSSPVSVNFQLVRRL